MNELKKNVMEVIDSINQDWVEALRVAEEHESGVDLSEMMGKFSANIVKLDDKFRDARQRFEKAGKGFWKGA